ncbi:endonuclease/exonuclease/phosphatase family protein [Baekduia soli]|uniref:endonuclease/exonuclease/phosphatase family protein n=1 Tax=Baekduia soli TaxID=496014 RepID=UPI001E49A094|nr:endonuclease/exonuclease/phosphatase family protein [Baekduia soli]
MTFTPYVGLGSPIAVLVALALRRWAVAAAGVVVAAAFALALLPRALPGPQPTVAGGVTVRVMTSNLYEGRGDPATVVDLVRRERVDVLALEELTPEALRRLDRAGLGRVLPFREADGRERSGGTGLFSRLPLRRLTPAVRVDFNGEPRAAVSVPGIARAVDVQAIHTVPPIHGDTGVWRSMLQALARPDGGPVLRLALGDFNATLDHAELRRLLGGGRGFVDAADAVGAGYRTTWPAGRRLPPEIAIDHVLVDPRVAVRSVSVHLVPFSDHRAVVATLELPGGRAAGPGRVRGSGPWRGSSPPGTRCPPRRAPPCCARAATPSTRRSPRAWPHGRPSPC